VVTKYKFHFISIALELKQSFTVEGETGLIISCNAGPEFLNPNLVRYRIIPASKINLLPLPSSNLFQNLCCVMKFIEYLADVFSDLKLYPKLLLPPPSTFLDS
jgi:hypothetical protein